MEKRETEREREAMEAMEAINTRKHSLARHRVRCAYNSAHVTAARANRIDAIFRADNRAKIAEKTRTKNGNRARKYVHSYSKFRPRLDSVTNSDV